MKKGILWLTLPNQITPVKQIYSPANHLHVTIKFDVPLESVAKYLGKNLSVELVENCWNFEIQAVKVRLPSYWSTLCTNKQPHITISHRPGVKPFKSNEMLNGFHESEVLRNKTLTLRSRFLMFGVGEIESIDDSIKNYKEV